MNSTSPQVSEPKDALAARADERLVHAYDQIARADEQLARVTEQLSKMERDAARPSQALGRRRPHERPAFRGLIGLLLAACIVVAAFLLQSPYGDAARLMLVARWAPQLVSTSTLPLKKATPGRQPERPGAEPAGPDGAAVQATTASPPLVVARGTAASPDLAQLLETVEMIARDLANVKQGIEQLKAHQMQMASDNANAVDQLRIRQEEMTGLLGKVFDQTLRLTSAAPPRQTLTLRKPGQASQSQVASPPRQARVPAELQPEQ